ncbi:MAG: acyl-CoA thioester hydrolase/BAAT C-terminal domain-containing protein [Marinicellaceae bacterium]
MIKGFFKWLTITFLLLCFIVVIYYYYLSVSFDSENLPENHGKVHSKLYLGKGNNLPLIVGLGGSEGGNAWTSDRWKNQREKFLSDGYAFLAIGYFSMPGIPEKLDRISLEGVNQAIIEAANHSQINQNCIALIGGSKGAELSLSLASRFSHIKSVVAIVPGHAVFAGITDLMSTSSWTYKNKPLPFFTVPWSALPALITGNLRGAFEAIIKNEIDTKQAIIPVENINGSILFISATKDEMWPSSEMSEMMIKRLSTNYFKFPYNHIAIEGGHSAPLAHFDKIEIFLKNNFQSELQNNCARN